MAHPIVHVYAVCYNEELLLPYFLRHYETVAEKIVVFDGESTDRSREILRAHPKVILEEGGGEFATHEDGKYHEPILMKIRNEAYKRSRGKADWVIIADIDEMVYHPDLLGHLAALRTQGSTILKVAGYEMVSVIPPSGPGQIYQEVKAGFLNHRYNKKAVFDPAIDIKYHFGCHDCDPVGNVVEANDHGIKLLHYRMIGPSFFVEKYAGRLNRFHPQSRTHEWGTHLSIPWSGAQRPFIYDSKDGLRKMFWDMLSEQEIVEVVA